MAPSAPACSCSGNHRSTCNWTPADRPTVGNQAKESPFKRNDSNKFVALFVECQRSSPDHTESSPQTLHKKHFSHIKKKNILDP